MRSTVTDVLPSKVKKSLVKLGGDLASARRKRGLTTSMVAERMGVAKTTYLRVEKGDPTVTLGVYAMALFVLGFPEAFADLVDASRDQVGLMLEEQNLPKRVRVKRRHSPPAPSSPPRSSRRSSS